MSSADSPKSSALVWIDLEMTGLDPDRDRIVEIGMVVTDYNLDVVAECEPIIVHHGQEVFDAMDEWNRKTHSRSGLIERSIASTLDVAAAEAQALAFLAEHSQKGRSPMCGNSICQDRRFLYRHMSELEAFFHYRNLDVSTLKEVAKIWKLDLGGAVFQKHGKHEALADVLESIAEMRHYLSNGLNVDLESGNFNLAVDAV